MEIKSHIKRISEKNIFETIKKFVEYKGIIPHQIESYNYLLETGLEKIFNEVPDIIEIPKKGQKYIVQFGQVHIDTPHTYDDDKKIKILYPNEARLRDLSYESNIYVDITETFLNEEEKEENKIVQKINNRVLIAKIPIMIGSSKCNLLRKTLKEKIQLGECSNDPGGYFIIKGKERVLIAQERINYNQIYIFEQKNSQKNNIQKFPYVAEIRSISEETSHSVLTQAKMSEDGKTIVFSLPYIKVDVPVGIVFKALGFSEKNEIRSLLGDNPKFDKYVEWIYRSSKQVENKRAATLWIGSNPIHTIAEEEQVRHNYGEQVLKKEVFPHLGIASEKEIAMYLGNMVSKLLLTLLGMRQEDDRDNISLKRIETAGILVYDLFRMLLKRFIDTARKYIVKRPDIISTIPRLNIITQGIKHSFATGNWGVQKNTYIRTGVSQVLSRLTYSSSISHLKRVNIPIGKEGKNTKIRQLHPTQMFFICPCESPDGQSIGILKNFAFSARSTLPFSSVIVRDIASRPKTIKLVRDLGLDDIKNTHVIVNGFIVGVTTNIKAYIEEIKFYRRKGLFPHDVSISYDEIDNEIRIFSDVGRFSRPIFTVKNNKLTILEEKNLSSLSWDEMIKKGYVQYVDSNEVENSIIAMTQDDLLKKNTYDYCEIHPSLMLGIAGVVIPYADHNQSPRNCYQTGMLKQALGIYCTSYNVRTDTVGYTLDNPQKPLITTPYADMLNFTEMVYGINAIVAIACYTGFNQEDSVILNRASVERGLFVSHSYKIITVEEIKKNTNNFETICCPDLDVRNKGLSYSKLDANGIVRKGMYVEKGDVIIGKIVTKIFKEEKEETNDASVFIKSGEEGIIDNIFVTTNSEGNKFIKIKIRNIRIPEIGDKFSSRYAQKGTCGFILNQEDMPFTCEGICPDIIINPHCIPSRMTIGQLIECIQGKVACMDGSFKDSTAFTEASNDPVEKISSELLKYGYNRYGSEMMYSGFTGEPLEAKVFIGPTYYQRLKHMVADKIHCRAIGNVTVMVRQPHEGRNRDGGLKLGKPFCPKVGTQVSASPCCEGRHSLIAGNSRKRNLSENRKMRI